MGFRPASGSSHSQYHSGRFRGTAEVLQCAALSSVTPNPVSHRNQGPALSLQEDIGFATIAIVSGETRLTAEA